MKQLKRHIAVIIAILVLITSTATTSAKNYISSVFIVLDDGSPITNEQTIRLSLWGDGRMDSGDVSSGIINTSAANYGGYQTEVTVTPDSYGRLGIALGSLPDFPDIVPSSQFLMIEYKDSGDPVTSYTLYQDVYIDNLEMHRFPLIENGPDIFQELFTNDATTADSFTLDRNDDASGNISIQFGETLAKSIQYDVSNTRFVINDDVRIEGNNSILGQLFLADDHAAADSAGIFNLGRNSGDWETLKWNNVNLQFELSDDLNLNSHQVVEARLENVTAMPGGATGLGAAGTGRVIQLTATDSVAPGCTGPSCSPGTYTWNGGSWIPLTGAPTVTTSSKIVTVGPVDRDYTSIAAAAAYLNTVSAGIMLIDPGTFPVTTTIDLENIHVIGKDSTETTIDISGSGVLEVRDTIFEDLTIDVDSGISGVSGLDVKYNASSNSSVQLDRVDFIIGIGKYLMDSTSGTPPITTINFVNSTQSGGSSSLVRPVASTGLSSSSTILVDDQLGLNPLKIEDWPVTIIGGGNVLTTGTITTIPDRTIYVSAGMNLQEAIDSLGASGGTIKLLIGTHDLTAPIVITDDNIEIVGEGPGTIVRTASGTWTGGTGEHDAVIQVGLANGTAPRTDVVIRNFKMEVGSNTHGISVNGGSENKVVDMIVQSTGTKTSTHTGIVFTDSSTALGEKFTAARNIVNSNIAGNRWVDGFHFDGNADLPGQLFGYGNGIRDSIISENIVSEAQETCYAFSQVSASSVFSNRARNIGFTAGAFGMFFNDAEDVMIINNTMEGANAAATGISLFDNVDNSTVMGNAVRGGPVNYSSGIDNASATNENNVINNNQLESVTTRIIDNGTETKMETNHHRGTTDPTINDDVNDGYEVGTIWINTSANTTYVLIDHTAGAAIWLALAYNVTSTTPPVACSATYAGRTFVDSDTGIMYVCDTSNGRNEWLSPQDIVIFGDESGACGSGANPNTDADCNVDWGNGLGPDTATDLGFFIPHPITITGYGFSEDNDACTSGSFDLEVWSTGSSTNDNAYSFESNIATGLTGQAHNSNSLNVDVDGNQYILWGIDNNCGQAIDDWNLVIYYRHRHP